MTADLREGKRISTTIIRNEALEKKIDENHLKKNTIARNFPGDAHGR